MRQPPAVGALVAMLVGLAAALCVAAWALDRSTPSPSDYASIQEE